MRDLKDLKVGDTLYIQPQRRRNEKSWPKPSTAVVQKVGRRWLTVISDGKWREERFDRDTARSESNHNDFANGFGRYGFASDEERTDFVADIIEAEWIKGENDRAVQQWRNWDLDGLRCLALLCESQRS